MSKAVKPRKSTKLPYIAFTALIMAVLALPAALMLLGVTGQNKEKRPLAREPELFVRGEANLDFPKNFDDYLQDHFALREELVSTINALTMGALGDTLNTKTIVGQNGGGGRMLFFADTLSDYQRTNTMSQYDIARAASVLRIMSQAANARSQRFIFCAAPNKNTVYPEFMPSRYYQADAQSNREMLYKALSAAGVDTVDLAGLLAAHKADGMLYHLEDTHWNARGALIAYRAIMDAAARGHYYDDYASAAAIDKYGYEGDLHNFVLPSVSGTGAYPAYDIAENFVYDDGTRINQDTTFATSASSSALRLTVFRDSFAIALLPYISNNAGRVVYSTEFPYNYTVSEASEADAIVVELVERNIPNLVLSAPVMQAVETLAPDTAARVSASVSVTAHASGLKCIFGTFEHDGFDPATQRIYVCVEGKYYEAFPVGEKNGFAVYVDEVGDIEVYIG